MSKPVAKTKVQSVGGEWIVRAYDANGKRMPNADYFASDKNDAVDTSKAMINDSKNNKQSKMKNKGPGGTRVYKLLKNTMTITPLGDNKFRVEVKNHKGKKEYQTLDRKWVKKMLRTAKFIGYRRVNT